MKSLKSVRRNIVFNKPLETGFSMLEAVVVVGVLLALAVGGFLAYGSITENAKKAKVKSEASELYTSSSVASSDGDSSTNPLDVIESYNDSTTDFKAVIKNGAGSSETNNFTQKIGEDFCVEVTNLDNHDISSIVGNCSAGGGIVDDEPVTTIDWGGCSAYPLIIAHNNAAREDMTTAAYLAYYQASAQYGSGSSQAQTAYDAMAATPENIAAQNAASALMSDGPTMSFYAGPFINAYLATIDPQGRQTPPGVSSARDAYVANPNATTKKALIDEALRVQTVPCQAI